MNSLLPDILTETQRSIGLAVSIALIVWGLGAAAWHIWIGESLTWRSRLFGRDPHFTKQQVRDECFRRGMEPTKANLIEARESLEFEHFFNEAKDGDGR